MNKPTYEELEAQVKQLSMQLELSVAAEKYRVTYADHRANPRDYEALEAWDKASFEFSEMVNNKELDIIAGLLAERDADKKRIAELEARTVSVKLPESVIDTICLTAAEIHNLGRGVSDERAQEIINSIRCAAGIKLEVGE